MVEIDIVVAPKITCFRIRIGRTLFVLLLWLAGSWHPLG